MGHWKPCPHLWSSSHLQPWEVLRQLYPSSFLFPVPNLEPCWPLPWVGPGPGGVGAGGGTYSVLIFCLGCESRCELGKAGLSVSGQEWR